MSHEFGKAMPLDQWAVVSAHVTQVARGGGLNPRFHLDSLVSPLRSHLTVVCGLSVVRHIKKTGSRTIAVAHSGTETFRFKL